MLALQRFVLLTRHLCRLHQDSYTPRTKSWELPPSHLINHGHAHTPPSPSSSSSSSLPSLSVGSSSLLVHGIHEHLLQPLPADVLSVLLPRLAMALSYTFKQLKNQEISQNLDNIQNPSKIEKMSSVGSELPLSSFISRTASTTVPFTLPPNTWAYLDDIVTAATPSSSSWPSSSSSSSSSPAWPMIVGSALMLGELILPWLSRVYRLWRGRCWVPSSSVQAALATVQGADVDITVETHPEPHPEPQTQPGPIKESSTTSDDKVVFYALPIPAAAPAATPARVLIGNWLCPLPEALQALPPALGTPPSAASPSEGASVGVSIPGSPALSLSRAQLQAKRRHSLSAELATGANTALDLASSAASLNTFVAESELVAPPGLGLSSSLAPAGSSLYHLSEDAGPLSTSSSSSTRILKPSRTYAGNNSANGLTAPISSSPGGVTSTRRYTSPGAPSPSTAISAAAAAASSTPTAPSAALGLGLGLVHRRSADTAAAAATGDGDDEAVADTISGRTNVTAGTTGIYSTVRLRQPSTAHDPRLPPGSAPRSRPLDDKPSLFTSRRASAATPTPTPAPAPAGAGTGASLAVLLQLPTRAPVLATPEPEAGAESPLDADTKAAEDRARTTFGAAPQRARAYPTQASAYRESDSEEVDSLDSSLSEGELRDLLDEAQSRHAAVDAQMRASGMEPAMLSQAYDAANQSRRRTNAKTRSKEESILRTLSPVSTTMEAAGIYNSGLRRTSSTAVQTASASMPLSIDEVMLEDGDESDSR